MIDLSKDAQLAVLQSIFRPAAPIDDRRMFLGRDAQLSRTLAAVQTVGQHAVVYGERGVGKTSLAYMARDAFVDANGVALAVRLACSAGDTFSTVWKKFVPRTLQALDLWPDQAARDLLVETIDRVEDLIGMDDATPDSTARALHLLSSRLPLMIVVDEFDRIGDPDEARMFADLIKTMSDDLVGCSLVIVGVADDVDSLIAGHRSVERAIRQVFMPRMTMDELTSIVTEGVREFHERAAVDLHISDKAKLAIARLSQGFPYYTHLLAGSVGELAITRGDLDVDGNTVLEALFLALDNATQAVVKSYTDATSAARSDAGYADTLLACAMTAGDGLGFFAAPDIAGPLSYLKGKQVSSGNYLHHLKKFCGPPGWALESRGENRSMRFRFYNPMMKPYVLMAGVRDGRLPLPSDKTDEAEATSS
jgi:hypothetical protein